LSQYITPDPEIEALLTELAGPIEELRLTPVGETTVFLVGDRAVCRAMECNLGNLITDAMRAETGAQIAITNGGGIRSNIPLDSDTPADIALAEPYTVTLGDVLTVLPFGNLVATFDLSGADVIASLEHGVSAIGTDSGTGRFPQVSGIRYTFDPSQEIGSRIVSVEVLGDDGTYTAIDPEATYSVVSNDFMRGGGDGYELFATNATNAYDFGRPLDQALADYIAANSPISPGIDGRIIIVGQ
jgi:5'-nucleotidase